MSVMLTADSAPAVLLEQILARQRSLHEELAGLDELVDRVKALFAPDGAAAANTDARPRRGRGIRLRDEEARDAVLELREFTAPELGHHLGVGAPTARRAMERLAQRGIISPTGRFRSITGRKSEIFAYQPPNGPGQAFLLQQAEQPHSPEPALHGRGVPVSGIRAIKTGNKDVDRLVAEATAHGCSAHRTGRQRVRLRTPDGEQVTVPGGPSDHRALDNTAAELRRAGVPVHA